MKMIEEFLERESSGGIVLIFVTVLALIAGNTFLSVYYNRFLHMPIEIRVGSLYLSKSLYHWVNDGLMSIFFLLVGLEVKREVLEGSLSSLDQISLPVFAALGGMAMPAAIYLVFNHLNPVIANGWAIPTATDIAFALGVISILGDRVPASLKMFLMALAIIDDLGAIIVIAIFYTSKLSFASLVIAVLSIMFLIGLNRFGVVKKAAYLIVGVILWFSVLKSGVHATLAGVALAFTIPLKARDEKGNLVSPLKELEHNLHFWVAFLILPLFAFVNAGVGFQGFSLSHIVDPFFSGIVLGLFFGKQLGVFLFSFLAIKLGLAKLPQGSNWLQFYGVAVLTGIGFTMSLFILSLAFGNNELLKTIGKMAILFGSFLSGVVGYFILTAGSKVG